MKAEAYFEATQKSRIKDPEERGECLDLFQASALLGLKATTVRQRTCYGQIPSYKRFGRRVWFKNELIKYLDLVTEY